MAQSWNISSTLMSQMIVFHNPTVPTRPSLTEVQTCQKKHIFEIKMYVIWYIINILRALQVIVDTGLRSDQILIHLRANTLSITLF